MSQPSTASRNNLRSIYVRCQGVDNEYAVVSPNNLPENPYDLVYLLKLETAPHSCWRDVAAAYFRTEKWSSGITVLEQATSDDVENILSGVEDNPTAGTSPCSRIDLLAALGGAYVMMAEASANDASARADALRKAADVLSRADKIDLDDPSIWAARGWAELHAEKPSAANWLDSAKDKNVVLGAIGMAALQINRTKPPDASRRDPPVALLVSALRSDVCPPGVWTGLAYALYKDGRFREARNVARRALAALRRSPPSERLEALYLLAVVELADRSSSSLDNMVLALQEAYTKCGGNQDARILSLIANMYFNGGDFAMAEQFAKRAVSAASRLPNLSVGSMFGTIHHNVQVESLFQLARAQHHLRKDEDAMDNLEQIKKLSDNPEFQHVKINPGVLLRLGLLKLSTGRREDEPLAKECLEKVLKSCNQRCGIAKRALGVLLGREVLLSLRKGRRRGGELYDRAVSFLKKGLEESPAAAQDIPAQLVYAALVEETYPKRAKDAYAKVIETLEEAGKEVDPEIWNNYSSILARTGAYEEAEQISMQKINDEFAAECGTVPYNRARITELREDFSKAEKMYRSIPKGAPHYNEAIIRIAVLLMKSPTGYAEAEKLLQEAQSSSSTRPTALAYLSMLYTAQKNYKGAQEALEKGTHESDYVTLALASFIHRLLDRLEEDRRNHFLVKHIGSNLQQLLTRNSHNACAANGVGVYFAESKMFKEARDAFSTAGSGPYPEKVTRVNLANVQILIGKKDLIESSKTSGRPTQRAKTAARSLFEQADKLFSDALRMTKLEGSKEQMNSYCELLLYSSWAQFESEDYRRSADTLTKLVHLMPHSFMSWYNLGLALLESALKRIMFSGNRLEELESAKAELEGARAAIQKCALWKKGPWDPITKTYVRSTVAREVERYIWLEMKSQDVNLRNAKMKEEDLIAKQEQRRKEMEKYEEAMREKERVAEERKLQKEEDLERAFAESELKRKENEENYRKLIADKQEGYSDDEIGDDKARSKAKRTKKKKKEPRYEDEEVGSGDEYASEKKTSKRKRKSSLDEDMRSSKKKSKKPEKSSYSSGDEYSDAEGMDVDGENGNDKTRAEGADGSANGGADGDGDDDNDSIDAMENGVDSGKRRKKIVVEDADDESDA